MSRAEREATLAADLAGTLCRTYPGYHWGVSVERGLITVNNAELDHRYGYRIKLQGIASAGELRREVRHAGGEILERHALNRAARVDGEVESLARGVRGLPKGEVD